MVSKLKVGLFLGSLRENRLGERVSKFMTTQLENAQFEVNVFGKTKCDISVRQHYKVVIFCYKQARPYVTWNVLKGALNQIQKTRDHEIILTFILRWFQKILPFFSRFLKTKYQHKVQNGRHLSIYEFINNFKNIICLKSDQEHISVENKSQYYLSLRKYVNNLIFKFKNSKCPPFIHSWI